MKRNPILVHSDGILLSRAFHSGRGESFSFRAIDHVDLVYRNKGLGDIRSAKRPRFFAEIYPHKGSKMVVRLAYLWQLLEIKEKLLSNNVAVRYVTDDDYNMQVLERGQSAVYREEWQIVRRWQVGGIVALASIVVLATLVLVLV